MLKVYNKIAKRITCPLLLLFKCMFDECNAIDIKTNCIASQCPFWKARTTKIGYCGVATNHFENSLIHLPVKDSSVKFNETYNSATLASYLVETNSPLTPVPSAD